MKMEREHKDGVKKREVRVDMVLGVARASSPVNDVDSLGLGGFSGDDL